MNEEFLKELINEIKELNEKMDILISDTRLDGYKNLSNLYTMLNCIYEEV